MDKPDCKNCISYAICKAVLNDILENKIEVLISGLNINDHSKSYPMKVPLYAILYFGALEIALKCRLLDQYLDQIFRKFYADDVISNYRGLNEQYREEVGTKTCKLLEIDYLSHFNRAKLRHRQIVRQQSII